MTETATNLQEGVEVADIQSQLKGYLDRQQQPAPQPKVEEENADEVEEAEEETSEDETDATDVDQDEEEDEEDSDESDDEEDDEDTATDTLAEEDLQKKIRVKSDDQEIEITVEEASKGYLRNQDYTRKTQEVAALKKGVIEEAEQLKQGLQMIDSFLLAELKPYEELDWEALKAEDKNEYLIKRDEYQSAVQRVHGIRETFQQVNQQQQAHQVELLTQKAQEEAAELAKYEPKLKTNKQEVSDSWASYAETLGFSREEMSSVIDHRLFVILDKAMKFDALQEKGKQVKDKKINKSGKRVVKGSQRDKKANQVQQQEKSLVENFNKRQNVDSAAELLRYRMGNN